MFDEINYEAFFFMFSFLWTILYSVVYGRLMKFSTTCSVNFAHSV